MPKYEWDKYTPTLDCIAEKIARDNIKLHWDFIANILVSEDQIYNFAFNSFSIAKRDDNNASYAYEIFETMLKVNHFDISLKRLWDKIHSEYWKLAKKKIYWRNNSFSFDDHISLSDAISLWEQNYENENGISIQEAEEKFKLWLNKN